MIKKRCRHNGLNDESVEQDQSLVDSKTKIYDFNSNFLYPFLNFLKERPLNSQEMEFHILTPTYLG